MKRVVTWINLRVHNDLGVYPSHIETIEYMTGHIETNDIYTVSAGSSDGGKRHFSFPTTVATINEWPQLNIPETKELKKNRWGIEENKNKKPISESFFSQGVLLETSLLDGKTEPCPASSFLLCTLQP